MRVSLPLKGLFELDDVLLLEHPEHLDFPESRFLHDLILIGFLELLDGD